MQTGKLCKRGVFFGGRSVGRPERRALCVVGCGDCCRRKALEVLGGGRRQRSNGGGVGLKKVPQVVQASGSKGTGGNDFDPLDFAGSKAVIEDTANEPTPQNGLTKKEEEETVSKGVSVALSFLKFYKSSISPLLPPSCRFVPTCSEYAMASFKEYGVVKGGVLTAWRLARCNPFGGSGYDPPKWPPPGLAGLVAFAESDNIGNYAVGLAVAVGLIVALELSIP